MTGNIKSVCIVGTGLIGGSLALALRRAGYCEQIIGAGRNEDTLKKAQELGVIDTYHMDMARAASQADIIVLSVPMGAMQSVLEQIKPGLTEKSIITDVGSVKQSVINEADLVLGERSSRFVAGHPIAGTEQSGVSAAFPDLFNNKRIILTPVDTTDAEAVEIVRNMWKSVGAVVESMTAEHHDMVLAGTSHLPHLLAYGLVDCLNNLDDVDEIFRFAAGGFRDFTRIASSDPVMWRDICLSNRVELMGMMKKYRDQMELIYRALDNNDGETLKQIFERAKKSRDQFSNE